MHPTWQKKRIQALRNIADTLNTCYRIIWTHNLPTNFSADYHSMIPAEFSAEAILEGGGRYKEDIILDFKNAKGEVVEQRITKHANKLYDAATYLETCSPSIQKQFKKVTGLTATGIKGKIERRFFKEEIKTIKEMPSHG